MTIQKRFQSQPFHWLYAIADNTFRPELSHRELTEAFLQGGTRVVQLRMKGDARRTTLRQGSGQAHDARRLAKAIMQLKKRYDFIFIINDYVEVAKEVGCDGVHVGRDDMPIVEVRKIVGDKTLIGYSSHSLAEALAAEKAGADYVAFGAIFPTKTKGPGHPVQGLDRLRKVVHALHVPVVAIGGIHRENFSSVLETGASAIAMITALTNASDIVATTRFFVSQFSLSYQRTKNEARPHHRRF